MANRGSLVNRLRPCWDLQGCSNTKTFLHVNLSCSIMGRKVRDGLVWSILSYYEIRFVLCFTLNRITLD